MISETPSKTLHYKKSQTASVYNVAYKNNYLVITYHFPIVEERNNKHTQHFQKKINKVTNLQSIKT